MNVSPNHLSQLELGDTDGAIVDQLPHVDLFKIEDVPDYLFFISLFLNTSVFPNGYSTTQKILMMVHV
jgi:hypothetical protein